MGGRAGHAMHDATFLPISKPGCLYDVLRGNAKGENPLAKLRESEGIPDPCRRPDARLRAMDAQGLEAVWLFPTLGVLYEQLLQADVEGGQEVQAGGHRSDRVRTDDFPPRQEFT